MDGSNFISLDTCTASISIMLHQACLGTYPLCNFSSAMTQDIHNIRNESIGPWYSQNPRKEDGGNTFVYETFLSGPLSLSIILINSARDRAPIFSIARLR